MNFLFTDKEQAFRQEVREFIEKETPNRWRELKPGCWEETDENVMLARQFQRKLAERGWLAPRYPKEYGGISATQWERVILAEELAYQRAPMGLEVEIAVDWIGPSILLFGTEEQKKKYVGGIGRRAIQLFEQFGVEIYVNARGTIKDAIDQYKSRQLLMATDKEACQQHKYRGERKDETCDPSH